MRWCRFQSGRQVAYGVIEENTVIEVTGSRRSRALWMGTDGATENMKDGDVVEVEITDIGVLRNPVVRERQEPVGKTS